jgi:hypothetical protein
MNDEPSKVVKFVPSTYERGGLLNRAGRPKGRTNVIRERLSRAFLTALVEDFERYGSGVIEIVRENDPVAYLALVQRTIAKLRVEVSSSEDEGSTAEEIMARLEQRAGPRAVDALRQFITETRTPSVAEPDND